MRYEGDIKYISAIQMLLINDKRFGLISNGGNDGDYKAIACKTRSAVYSARYQAQLNGVNALVTLGFDWRNKNGHVILKDDCAWIVASNVKGFAEAMQHLSPYYRPRSQYAIAVDRLLLNGKRRLL